MGIYEFNKLALNEKAQFTWDFGKYLHFKIEDDKRFNLYSLSYFFVEVEYDNKENLFIGIKSFNSLKLLQGYIDNIDLNNLF